MPLRIHLVSDVDRASSAGRCVENRCDVIMGYAQGDEMVLNTNHYYTSTHVLVVRADGDLADVDTPRRPAASGAADRGDRRRAAGEPRGAATG